MVADTKCDIEVKGNIPVIKISGELDHFFAPQFRNTVDNLVGRGYKDLITDLTGVNFMDSGGMSGLIYALKRLSAVNGQVRLTGCHPRVVRKIEISGILHMPNALSLCSSVEEAIKEIETGAEQMDVLYADSQN